MTLENLEQATVKQLQSFIHNCLGVKSKKTGKYIHINTYKWSKADLLNLITNSGYALTALQYLNGEDIF